MIYQKILKPCISLYYISQNAIFILLIHLKTIRQNNPNKNKRIYNIATGIIDKMLFNLIMLSMWIYEIKH
jgi:hypothetical protein